jgi:hypothetical protein
MNTAAVLRSGQVARPAYWAVTPNPHPVPLEPEYRCEQDEIHPVIKSIPRKIAPIATPCGSLTAMIPDLPYRILFLWGRATVTRRYGRREKNEQARTLQSGGLREGVTICISGRHEGQGIALPPSYTCRKTDIRAMMARVKGYALENTSHQA